MGAKKAPKLYATPNTAVIATNAAPTATQPAAESTAAAGRGRRRITPRA